MSSVWVSVPPAAQAEARGAAAVLRGIVAALDGVATGQLYAVYHLDLAIRAMGYRKYMVQIDCTHLFAAIERGEEEAADKEELVGELGPVGREPLDAEVEHAKKKAGHAG